MANEFIARNGIIAKNNTVITGSLTVTGGITGSLSGSISNATSASYALTASYAMNGGGGGGSTFPYSGAAVITGSLSILTDSNSHIFNNTDVSFFNNLFDFGSNGFNINGSYDQGNINVGPYIFFTGGNQVQYTAYGVEANSSYLFLGDYVDNNDGTSIFVDDSARLIKFGNFNSGTAVYDGSNMNIAAQINTVDGSGYFLNPGVGGTATIHWDASGNMTWGGVDYSPGQSSITFQPEYANIWLFNTNQDTLHLAPFLVQSDYFTLSNYVSFDGGLINSDGSGNFNINTLITGQNIPNYSNDYWSFGDANTSDPGTYWADYSGTWNTALSVSVGGNTYLIPAVGFGQ
jgi:hypothetical protein